MFELHSQTATLKTVTPREEKHGDESVPAISMRFEIQAANTILDALLPSLRTTLYTKPPGQYTLDGIEETTPLLRTAGIDQVLLQSKFEGWSMAVDFGIDDTTAIRCGSCKVDKFTVEPMDGGTVRLFLRVRTSDISAESAGNLMMMIGGDVTLSLTAPKPAAAAIDGSTEAFKRDHPDAEDGEPASTPGDPERGENWPFPVGNDAPQEQADATGEPEPDAGVTTAGKGGTKGGKRGPTKAPDAADAFIAAHAGPVQ